jgi:hypothetical protein
MPSVGDMTPEAFFADHPDAMAVYRNVLRMLEPLGAVTVRASRSQVAFRRRRGFAYLWMPGMYLARPAAEVVLSIALDRELVSSRFKEVVHPSPRIWMHHLEISSLDDLDDEVLGWLRAAYEAA